MTEYEEAFSRFYRELVTPLTAYLVSQGASVHLAAEIAQDTMLKAYRKWHEITWRKSWVYAVAYKAYVRHVTRVDEEPVEEVPEPTPLLPRPDQAESWAQQREIVHLLSELPPRQRQVLALHHDGWTTGEIAGLLGIREAAVRQNLHKARLAAARYIEGRREE
jgi:RNA polymerase sigma-70 factor (ECF subfamily)